MLKIAQLQLNINGSFIDKSELVAILTGKLDYTERPENRSESPH